MRDVIEYISALESRTQGEVEAAIAFAVNYVAKGRGFDMRTNWFETNEVLNTIEAYKHSLETKGGA